MTSHAGRLRAGILNADRGAVASSLIVQRRCACGKAGASLDGQCAACRGQRLGVQRKLIVGPAHDAFERQADAVEASMASGRPVQASGMRGGIGRISRASAAAAVSQDATGAGMEAPASVHDALSDPGRPLDGKSRSVFEPRFGYDFSRVRIHTGSTAARSAAEIGARAYTVGEHIVLGNGHAAGADSSASLLAHELTHVVQQGDGGALVQRDLVFANGYPNPFKGNPAGETAAAAKTPREWFPSSVDFADTATLSGGGTGISTLSGLLAEIGKKSAGSLTDLDLIGHANGDLFALGGTITTTSVSGSKGGTIGPNQLAAAQPDIDKVRDRFSPNGRITIYGCNSGASGALLAALSTAFKVCARGFKDEITWCLGWQTNPLKITSRGRTLINPKDGTPCDQYEGSIYNHTPDTSDCSGTKPKPPKVTLPDRKPSVPEVEE